MKKIQTMNDAFLMKIVWRFMKVPEALWSQVLTHKYKEGPCLQSKPSDSPFWKDITKLWHALKEYCSVAIGDGSTTSFWDDVWVQNEGCLSSKALTPIPDEQKNGKVVEYTNGRGEWDLEKLMALLPTEVIDKIR
ncbi:Putative ribonuclease H protein [Arachis hypogaea]|nr:Putative ribonuclease H protein [Arachis hypogaea]